MRFIRYRLALPLLALGLIIIAVAAGMLRYQSGGEVCLRCGATRKTTHYRVPGTMITWQSSSPPASTAFSQFVMSQGLVGMHDHEWTLSHGARGIHWDRVMLLGKAMYVEDTVRKEEPVRLLEALAQRGLLWERDKFLKAILSPAKTRPALDIAYTFASAAPSDEKEFKEWLEKHKNYWDRMRNSDAP